MEIGRFYSIGDSVSEPEEESLAFGRYLGEIGTRQEFQLTVLDKRPLEQGYALELVRFTDDEGFLVIWWASKKTDLHIGTKYRLKATVRKHEVYRGTKRTVVNRVNVIGVFVAPMESQEGVGVGDAWEML